MNLSPEFVVFLLGLGAALAGVQSLGDVAKKAWWAILLFILGIAAQIGTQFVQYRNAITNKAQHERTIAFSLYAYTEKDMGMLKLIAIDNPYLIGYRYFKDGKPDAARAFFEQSLEKNSFVAPSHYMLAHISRTTSKDWGVARKHIEEAIAYDEKYAAAYYQRAIMKSKTHEPLAALEDLQRAARFGVTECFDLVNSKEVKEVWQELANNDQFKDIQLLCRERFNINK